jgi:transposase-like protein
MNLIAFMKTFGTDEACRAHMQRVRWPDGPVCAHCGVVNEAGAVGGRPGVFRCHACKSQFSVTVGTAMEGTHLPLNIWYLAMYLMLSTAKPISAMSLSRQMQIQYRTCWHLLRRLRAMLANGETLPLAGIVEADETYVGGKPRNRQKHRPALATRGRGTDKPMVFAAIERGGPARTAVVASASGAALDPLMFRWFDRDSILCTDELATYNWFGGKMRRHRKVTHSAGEYARTEGAIRVHTNTAEGFFGLFKMALVGIHHAVSGKHLHRYVAEHEFRYNRRGHDVGSRIARCLIGQHGRLRLRDLFA